MLRLNRGRVIGILLTTFIIYFLFLSSANTNSDFRKRTEDGLSRRHSLAQGDLSDEAYRDQTNQKLSEILAQREQKQHPLRVSDEGPGPAPVRAKDDTEGQDGTPAAGRKTTQEEKEKPKYPVGKNKEQQESMKKGDHDDDDDIGDDENMESKQRESADPAKDIARAKLQEYMKKPVIIFSKSYCPHSKRAKHLLLNLYKITPAPLVVELDQLTERLPLPNKKSSHEDHDHGHEQEPTLGQKLQELLGEITGRRTVPNIMVGTTSIGGNDLIWEMHESGALEQRIKDLGGKRVVSVEALDPEEADEHRGHEGHHRR